MFENIIGKRSNKVLNVVERGAVRSFVNAIDDVHPIYIDEEVGRRSRFGQNICPPTFPCIFDYGDFSDVYLPNIGLIHGEQTYHYGRPIRVGESIYCWKKVKDYKEKTGKSGTMGILTVEEIGEDEESNNIFRAEKVIIITESVRRELIK